MEIKITCRSEKRKDFLSYASKFYAKKLKLDNSTYSLTVKTVSNLRKNKKCNGVVTQVGYRNILMLLDTKLPMVRMLLTLAHEMVHVKQIAKGQYKGKIAKNGRVLSCWMGKSIKAEYMERPWEIEAFSREIELLKNFANEGLRKYLRKFDK